MVTQICRFPRFLFFVDFIHIGLKWHPRLIWLLGGRELGWTGLLLDLVLSLTLLGLWHLSGFVDDRYACILLFFLNMSVLGLNIAIINDIESIFHYLTVFLSRIIKKGVIVYWIDNLGALLIEDVLVWHHVRHSHIKEH